MTRTAFGIGALLLLCRLPVHGAIAVDPPSMASPRWSVSEVVRAALERSPELTVIELEPEILEALAEEERALFDPLFTLVAGREQLAGRDMSSGGILFDFRNDDIVGEALLVETLPSGTAFELSATTEIVDESRFGRQLAEARVGAVIRQPLLRGSRSRDNLARVTAARLEADAARWEGVAFAESLAALVEQTCWDLLLAEAQVSILETSRDDARTLLDEVRERVEGGAFARDELVAAESEIALREQDLVEARAAEDLAQTLLAGYLDLHARRTPGPGIRIADALRPGEAPLRDVERFVEHALARRPDLVAARERAARGEVEVRRTRHALLPRIDALIEGARIGYGDDTGRAWDDLGGGHWYFRAALAIEEQLGGRDDRADHRRELARRQQAVETLTGLERLVETEVRVAHALARRASEAASAIARTRALDEAKLRVEAARFDLGRASAFQVARAQRDLVRRRIDEVTALAEHRKLLAELYRAEGSLLERHGVAGERVRANAGAPAR